MKNEKHKIYSQLTEEDKSEIVNFYYNHPELKQNKIASEMNISQRAMRQILKEKHVNPHLKNRYKFNENYFECLDSPKKAYLLGFLFADGFVGNDSNQIVLSSTDKEVIDLFASEIDYTGKIRESHNSGYGSKKIQYSVQVNSSKMKRDLKKYGMIYGKGVRTKHLPEIEEPLLFQFIRGYAEADGSLSIRTSRMMHNNHTYEYERCFWTLIGQKNLLEEVAEKLNIKPLLKESHTNGLFYLNTQKISTIKGIYDLMYKDIDFGIARKIQAIQNYISSLSAIRQ